MRWRLYRIIRQSLCCAESRGWTLTFKCVENWNCKMLSSSSQRRVETGIINPYVRTDTWLKYMHVWSESLTIWLSSATVHDRSMVRLFVLYVSFVLVFNTLPMWYFTFCSNWTAPIRNEIKHECTIVFWQVLDAHSPIWSIAKLNVLRGLLSARP